MWIQFFKILLEPSLSDYDVVELIIRLIGGGLAPSSQNSRILIKNTLARKAVSYKWSEHSYNGFAELPIEQHSLDTNEWKQLS